MSASFIRAFFAVDLPIEIKQQLTVTMDALKRQLETTVKQSSFRWVRPQHLHVTLQFLGSVDEDAVTKLLRQAREELEGLKSFYMNLGALEWFPSSSRPQVLSLKAEPQEVLGELARALSKAAAALAYRVEKRPFRAHLTLARIEGLHNLDLGLLSSVDRPLLPEIFVKEVVFFRSEPQSGGSVYTRIASIELGNA